MSSAWSVKSVGCEVRGCELRGEVRVCEVRCVSPGPLSLPSSRAASSCRIIGRVKSPQLTMTVWPTCRTGEEEG